MQRLNRGQLVYVCLILLLVLVNAFGFMVPLFRNDDPVLYANIAKHIAQSNDWLDLINNNKDWLDKPHFPFWATACSFKIFGITSFAYMFPGFLFYLLGAVFTWKLALILYDDLDIAFIATIIYFSALHLMYSATVDARAEVYILGEIIPACYYVLRACRGECGYKAIFWSSFFTALALMTKGVFLLVPIFSGVLAIYCWQQFAKTPTAKVKLSQPLLMLILIALFILPELIALYYQFDSQPHKLIFGHYHVSGIEWFFWGSQFGRLFNDGAIVANHVKPFHYLFFIHTMLWAFLPWSVVFVVALVIYLKKSLYQKLFTNNDDCSKQLMIAKIYLLGSFVPTFILFSVSEFQLDHYTNILMPFAAIITSGFLVKISAGNNSMVAKFINYFQIGLSIILMFGVIILSWLIWHNTRIDVLLLALVTVIALFLCRLNYLNRVVAFGALAMSLVFIFIVLVSAKIIVNYDLGYQVTKYLNIEVKLNHQNGKLDLLLANNLPLFEYVDRPYNDFVGMWSYYEGGKLASLTQCTYDQTFAEFSPYYRNNYLSRNDYYTGSLTTNFYYEGKYRQLTTVDDICLNSYPCLLLIRKSDYFANYAGLQTYNLHLLRIFKAATNDVVMRYLFNLPSLDTHLTDYGLFIITGKR